MSEVKIEKSYDYADGKCIPFIKITLEPCHPDDNSAWNSRDELAKSIAEFPAAQSKLSALQEELAVANHEIESRIGAEVSAIEALQTAERRNTELLKAVEQSIEWLETMSSGDGSGHADLARAIRRIAKLPPPTESGAIHDPARPLA